MQPAQLFEWWLCDDVTCCCEASAYRPGFGSFGFAELNFNLLSILLRHGLHCCCSCSLLLLELVGSDLNQCHPNWEFVREPQSKALRREPVAEHAPSDNNIVEGAKLALTASRLEQGSKEAD